MGNKGSSGKKALSENFMISQDKSQTNDPQVRVHEVEEAPQQQFCQNKLKLYKSFKISKKFEYLYYWNDFEKAADIMADLKINKALQKEIQYQSGFIYVGEKLLKQRHGKGKLQFEMKEKRKIQAQGVWENNYLRQGRITIQRQDQKTATYEGEFLKNLPHGKGKLYEIDQEVYTGDWKKGRASGFGIMYFNEQTHYEGQFLEGRLQGEGIFQTTIPESEFIIEGSFKNNMMQGKGKFRKDGYYYDGDMTENKRNGQGYEEWQDGTYYCGQYQQNKRHGKGKMYLAPQDILYEGTWKDNFLDGKGTVSKPLQIIQIETINGKISKKGSTIVQDPIKEESESSDLVFSLYF